MERHHFLMLCLYGHLPIVEYLISKGENIEAKDEY